MTNSGLNAVQRHIKGGRQRLRQSLYAATLPAVFYWNAQLKAVYKRLIAAGKTHDSPSSPAPASSLSSSSIIARGTTLDLSAGNHIMVAQDEVQMGRCTTSG